MEHLPFKTWLVERSGLNTDEEEILQDHLAACPDCSALEHNLRFMDSLFEGSPARKPRDGFTLRFQASLEHRREREQARQIRKWLTGLFIAIGINMLLIVAAAVYTRTTSAWLVNLAVVYGNLLGFFDEAGVVFHTARMVVPPTFWYGLVLIAFAWGIAGLGFWLWTMRRILFSGVNHEI